MKYFFIFFQKILHLLNFNKKFHETGIMVSYTHEVKTEDFANFENLIQTIQTTHNIITPSQFFNYFENNLDIPQNSILMTFDDGFLSSYYFAKKILNKYNIKAIFFIPTKILELETKAEMQLFTNNNIYFNKFNKTDEEDFLFINTNQLLDLINDGHYIAPHTHNHVIIKKLKDLNSINAELEIPKSILQKYFPKNRSVFAFPVGTEKQVDKFSYKHIIRNYNYCFTTLVGINTIKTNRHCLHRFNLPPNSSVNYLYSILLGSSNIYYRFKMRILKTKSNA
jgi:peptidoglycan/xylan/chitin deacetylase (PgdA/CDA1 family)